MDERSRRRILLFHRVRLHCCAHEMPSAARNRRVVITFARIIVVSRHPGAAFVRENRVRHRQKMERRYRVGGEQRYAQAKYHSVGREKAPGVAGNARR